MLRAMVYSFASSSADNSLPVKTITGRSDSVASSPIARNTSKPDISGRLRSSTTQSKRSSMRPVETFGAGPCRDDLDVVIFEQGGDR